MRLLRVHGFRKDGPNWASHLWFVQGSLNLEHHRFPKLLDRLARITVRAQTAIGAITLGNFFFVVATHCNKET
jgi:hypothetical protein